MAKASRGDDQYMVRFPEGLRDRIKKAAERSGRSMNSEIIATLEYFYPPEPSIEEVLDRVHAAIELAQNSQNMPYRKVLIDALDRLSDQVSAGMELDQFRPPATGLEGRSMAAFGDRYMRWKRAQKHGVETQDVEKELERGMFSRLPGDRVRRLLKWFAEGSSDLALEDLRLSATKFVDKDAVIEVLQKHFDQFYRENWGDPDDPGSFNEDNF